MTYILEGMCYAGKTTLGKMLGEKLNIPSMDSRDLFFNKYNISENDYLKKYGKEDFKKAEKETLYHDFNNTVFSLGGSAIYYPKEMELLKEKYTIIWLNVPFEVITYRKSRENWERPIVFPDGIDTFKQLYNQRYNLYKECHDIEIKVTETDTPEDVIQKILKVIN